MHSESPYNVGDLNKKLCFKCETSSLGVIIDSHKSWRLSLEQWSPGGQVGDILLLFLSSFLCFSLIGLCVFFFFRHSFTCVERINFESCIYTIASVMNNKFFIGIQVRFCNTAIYLFCNIPRMWQKSWMFQNNSMKCIPIIWTCRLSQAN